LWASEDPSRLLREIQGIADLSAASDWLTGTAWGTTEAGHLRLAACLTIDEKEYAVDLIYPALFPDTPAYVKARNGERWSAHQYGGGTLCLEWGPDNWHSDVTGVDLLRSAHKLLATERSAEPGRVESRHRSSEGQDLRQQPRRIYLDRRALNILAGIPARSVRKVQLQSLFRLEPFRTTSFIGTIEKAQSGEFEECGIPFDKTGLQISLGQAGYLFKCDDLSVAKPPTTFDELVDQVKELGFEDGLTDIVAGSEEGTTSFVVLLLDGTGVGRAIAVTVADRTIGHLAVLRSEVDGLVVRTPDPPVCRRVGIVGLGSVGSKVAVSMTRAGFRNFVLVDDDVFKEENLVRHELNWLSLGMHKVTMVKEAVLLVAPDAIVSAHCLRLSDQESSFVAASTLESLANCDLIIDATANSRVFVLLAAIAKRAARPLVAGELFAGAIGGLMMRSIPGDGGGLLVRAAVYGYLQTLPDAPFQAPDNDYDVEDEGGPLIATDAEVSQFAATLARFAIDALATSREFPHGAYLLGLKKGWVFREPFDTRPISVGEVRESPAPTGAVSETDQKNAMEFLRRVGLAPNAHVDPST